MRIRENSIPFIALVAVILSSCSGTGEKLTTWYKNPVLHEDYSDPDVIRAGDDYYMVASSFNCVPGLPVLHSTDLVSWELIGYALEKLQPEGYYSSVRHGGGVWAPCIRMHAGEFYIFYPDPDYGIFMVKASDPRGPWSAPVAVMSGRGLIDPSPLWDDDGNAYLAYAFAGSRAGVKSVLMVTRMKPDGTGVIGGSVMVFDGHDDNPTVEGPKFYKRNGFYYLFAPAGGVTNGWQLALRSEKVFGPYEVRRVMHQGSTAVNGPHQGAWVTTAQGEDWFIHFQDKGPYGRIVHLQPLNWVNDWPVTGSDEDGDGIGEPVLTYDGPAKPVLTLDSIRKPVLTYDGPGGAVHKNDVTRGRVAADSVSRQHYDEFDDSSMPLDWQWHANPSLTWGWPSEATGCYRLNCIARPDSMRNLWDVSNLFLRKLPAEKFTATASVKCILRSDGEEAGMIIMGRDFQYISLKRTEGRLLLRVVRCTDADSGNPEEELFSREVASGEIQLRVTVGAGALCRFSFSTDAGGHFDAGGDIDSGDFSYAGEYYDAGEPFKARQGMWIGAKVGFFALRDGYTNDAGCIDISRFGILTTE